MIMADFNFLITHPRMTQQDYRLNRKYVWDNEPYKLINDRTTDIYDILVECGVFKSKNDARRNWKKGPIVDGLNDFEDVGKLRHRIFIHRIPEHFKSRRKTI